MTRWISWAGLLLLGLSFGAGEARIVPPVSGPARADLGDLSALQSFADAVVREGKVPGIAISIGVGDGPARYIVAGKAGFGAGDPAASADTLWRIYSMTKPITGLAAMILVEQGKLRLDQPVSDIFPEFRVSRVLTDPAHGLQTRPASGAITIRELLTHTSGLDYAIVIDTPARRELERQGITPFQANPAVEAKARGRRQASLQAFARLAAGAPLVADPGTEWHYSMGLDVLAAVVERVGGMPFDAFVQRHILTPLKMTSTYWQVPASQIGRFASSYAPKPLADGLWPGMTVPATDALALVDAGRNSVYLQRPSFPYGGAGLVSSARDYDRFLHMLLNDGALDGARILRAETVRLARSNLLPPSVFLSGSGPIPADEKFGFGAGGFVNLEEIDQFGRGKGTFGWDGAAGTRAWIDPVRHLRVTMMINVFGASALGNKLDQTIANEFPSIQKR